MLYAVVLSFGIMMMIMRKNKIDIDFEIENSLSEVKNYISKKCQDESFKLDVKISVMYKETEIGFLQLTKHPYYTYIHEKRLDDIHLESMKYIH